MAQCLIILQTFSHPYENPLKKEVWMNDRLKEGSLSWTQASLLRPRTAKVKELRGEAWIESVVDLPSGVGLAEIETALKVVIQRHEVLRSTFEVDRQGRGCQVVWEPASKPLSFSRPPGGDTEATECRNAYDPTQDWPVRYALNTSSDGMSQITFSANHAAADLYGLEVLGHDFLLALRDPATVVGTSEAFQSIDIAKFESSTQGKAANDRAIKYWLDHLDGYTNCHERLWRGEQNEDSLEFVAGSTFAGLQGDIERIAAANHVPVSVIAISVISRAFSILKNWEMPYFELVVANRHMRGSRTAVCTLAQRTILATPTSGSVSLEEFSRSCFSAVFRAARSAHYNNESLKRAINANGGSAELLSRRLIVINFIASSRILAPSDLESDDLVLQTRRVKVSEVDSGLSCRLLFHLHPNAIKVLVWANSNLFSEVNIRDLFSLIPIIFRAWSRRR